jgi:hypothetical protein
MHFSNVELKLVGFKETTHTLSDDLQRKQSTHGFKPFDSDCSLLLHYIYIF